MFQIEVRTMKLVTIITSARDVRGETYIGLTNRADGQGQELVRLIPSDNPGLLDWTPGALTVGFTYDFKVSAFVVQEQIQGVVV